MIFILKKVYDNYLLTLLAVKDHSLLIVEKEISLLKGKGSRNTMPVSSLLKFS